RLLPSSRSLFLVTNQMAERHFRGAIADFQTAQVPPTPWQGTAQKVRLPGRALWAAGRTLSVMRAFRPHVMVALGGHTCVVPALVGRMLGVKTLLFESNAIPGRVVRLLAPLADCVVLQWERAAARLEARRTVVCGNPVRSWLLDVPQQAARRRLGLSAQKRTLLATGGSQGALALNEALYDALGLIQASRLDLQVIHLTGVVHLGAALEHPVNRSASYRPIGFLERVEEAYAAADFVLSRAGGSTLAYLTALGLPSVLIPYPYAAERHQHANAAVLAEAGAAISIDQSELTARRLARAITALATRDGLRAQMAERARRLGRPRAAFTVAAELARMAGFGPQMELSPEDEGALANRFPRAA
ncbi:MAG: UDP-N-acetylglucosamine--N-acetylmuramyl-(pentapeptide) pyrophosphoryl-undecaprenol N-acetylglucosamine transferase, partial [Candidatus Brocadiae bacterium]|nr:UDP-N-acetylglucosamine--N-acetylmuramyl-(pentapeptide) pyrophosphoryl-undecaprenol N-acetylglucosamine transferase [Candidatus Brocadiia bacterium]